jgi:streptomycin 6-kinase
MVTPAIRGTIGSMRDHPDLPRLDVAGRRLVRRFGDGVQSWLEELPGHLLVLRERWSIELHGVIEKGSMSVVIRCRTAQGQRAVLKISPDRERIYREMASLAHWSTPHVPTAFRADPAVGALLMEEIEPGTPLQESGTYPALGDLAELLTSFHTHGMPDLAMPSVTDRVVYLFAAWARERHSHPSQVALVSQELFDRGQRLALRLAAEPSPTVLLHGDFTPVNILDGGQGRGLVAIDPCPTLGDPAFDPIDMLFWQAGDVDTISRRAELLAPAIGVEATRLLDWCTAFAGMAAADLEATGQRAEPPSEDRGKRVAAALCLADEAPG